MLTSTIWMSFEFKSINFSIHCSRTLNNDSSINKKNIIHWKKCVTHGYLFCLHEFLQTKKENTKKKEQRKQRTLVNDLSSSFGQGLCYFIKLTIYRQQTEYVYGAEQNGAWLLTNTVHKFEIFSTISLSFSLCFNLRHVYSEQWRILGFNRSDFDKNRFNT